MSVSVLQCAFNVARNTCLVMKLGQQHGVIWPVLHEAVLHGPSVLADVFGTISFIKILQLTWIVIR